jgi:hypothetical protein
VARGYVLAVPIFDKVISGKDANPIVGVIDSGLGSRRLEGRADDRADRVRVVHARDSGRDNSG